MIRESLPRSFVDATWFTGKCQRVTRADFGNERQLIRDAMPLRCKVRQGHKGWLTVKLVKCRVRAKIENEIGDEETLIVSKWHEDNGKPRCDYR